MKQPLIEWLFGVTRPVRVRSHSSLLNIYNVSLVVLHIFHLWESIFFAKRLTISGKYWFSPWLQWCSLCNLWVEWSSPSKHFLNQNSRPIFLIHFKINVVVFFCSFLEILDCLLDQFDPLAFFCLIFSLLPDMCKWRELLFWFVPVFGVARPQSALVGRPHHVVYGRRAVCRKQRFPAGGAPMASAWHRIILATTESFASQFWSVVWRGVHGLF